MNLRRVKEAFFRNEEIIIGVSFFILIIVSWEVLVGKLRLLNPVFVSYPSAIFDAFVFFFSTGKIWPHLQISLTEAVIGYFAGAVLGISFGLLVCLSKRASYALEPLTAALYATPKLALAPLFIVALGIGMESKAALILLLCFFPISYNTIAGLKATDPILIKAAKSFQANNRQVFLKVRLPSALPYIVTGLRLSVGRALTGIVAGELWASRAGIGFLIVRAGNVLRLDEVWVGVITLAMLGLTADRIMRGIEKKMTRWRGT